MTTPALRPMPDPVLRLVEGGVLGRYLPGWSSLEIGGDLGEQLVISLAWPTDSPFVDDVGELAEIAVLLDGEEIPDGRFLIDELQDEEVIDSDVVTRNGNSLLYQLSYAIVYPESGPVTGTNTTTPGWGFSAQTPGQALRELLEAAQTRGWWTDLVWDFGDGVDSGGAAWDPDIDDFYDQGTTLLDIVVKWKTRKVAVAKMVGGTLQLFRYDNAGPDLTATVMLLRDVDLTEGPVSRSSRNTVSTMLVVTDGITDDAGFGVTRTDAPALSKYGRREGFVSQSQVPDPSILQAIGDGTLALKARQREAYTYGLTCSTAGRQPFVDYDRGAEVTLRVKGETRVMRVRQLSVAWAADGSCTGSAAFGDRRMESDEQLTARLEQLTNGSMDGGAFGQPVLGSPDQNPGGGGGDTSPDTMPPAPPTGLSASSVSVFNLGYLSATATVTWSAPTTNQDGTALNDLGGYEVQYRAGTTGNWTAGPRTDKDTTLAVLTALTVGQAYQWRVRAFDIWSNASSWTQAGFTAQNDTVAPAQTPSTPTVTTFLFSGLMVTWDGLAAGGTAIDNDIRHVEVHVSTASGFAPGSGTLRDRIDIGGGSTVIGELTPGTTYYVKFRSVDWAGNLGPSSAQATGVPDSVQSGDIATGAVTGTKIANVTIGTAQIADLAVTDAKMASLSVTKLTTGTLTAVVTNSGTIQTAASGARTLINSAGIKLFDAVGNTTVSMNGADGTASFTGVIGAATITGYVKVFSGTSAVLVQNVGGVPTVTMTTGRLIEKYPSYLFTSGDAILRLLTWSVNSPGSQYAAGGFDYSNISLSCIPYDGDFANATTLPTKMSGNCIISFPTSLGGARPRITMQPNYTALTGGNDFHRYTTMVLKDGTTAQHAAGWRLDDVGPNQEDCVLAGVKRSGGVDGGAYAGITGAAFTVNSGRAVKSEVSDVPYSALEVVRANPAKRWRYTDNSTGSYSIGPMADDLPPEVTTVVDKGLGMPQVVEHQVDLLSMIGLLWRAVEELQERMEDLA